MDKKLYCGAAKVKITPPSELMPNLRGLMKTRFVAIADDIYVRALALRSGDMTALFVGYDLDKAPNPQETMEKIRDTYGIPVENITYYSIHTHTTPAVGKRPGEIMNNPRLLGEEVSKATDDYEAFIAERTMEAVGEALKSIQPARMAYGTSQCGVNVNRNVMKPEIDENGNVTERLVEGHNPLGPVDHTVYVVRFTDAEGKPIAFLMNYAVHCTTMFMNNYDGEGGAALSGDIGGNTSQLVEKKFDGAVALWCSGPAGDVNPMLLRVDPAPVKGKDNAPKLPEQYIQKVCHRDAVVNQNYAAVLRAIGTMGEGTDEAEIGCRLTFVETPGRNIIREGQGPSATMRIEDGPDVAPYRIRTHVTRIGKLAFCGIGGELYTTHAAAVRAVSPLRDIIIINHDASMIEDAGYILDDDTWDKAARSPAGGRSIPGAPGRFKKGYIADALSGAVSEMLEELL